MHLHLSLLLATGVSIALANAYHPDAEIYLRDVDELDIFARDFGYDGLYGREAALPADPNAAFQPGPATDESGRPIHGSTDRGNKEHRQQNKVPVSTGEKKVDKPPVPIKISDGLTEKYFAKLARGIKAVWDETHAERKKVVRDSDALAKVLLTGEIKPGSTEPAKKEDVINESKQGGSKSRRNLELEDRDLDDNDLFARYLEKRDLELKERAFNDESLDVRSLEQSGPRLPPGFNSYRKYIGRRDLDDLVGRLVYEDEAWLARRDAEAEADADPFWLVDIFNHPPAAKEGSDKNGKSEDENAHKQEDGSEVGSEDEDEE